MHIDIIQTSMIELACAYKAQLNDVSYIIVANSITLN